MGRFDASKPERIQLEIWNFPATAARTSPGKSRYSARAKGVEVRTPPCGIGHTFEFGKEHIANMEQIVYVF
jgi:hypothetical protein